MTDQTKADRTDIIDELLDNTDQARTASGYVGQGGERVYVVVSKERYTTRGQRTKWKVEVDSDRDSVKETFDTAVAADEYFEMLCDDYNNITEDDT